MTVWPVWAIFALVIFAMVCACVAVIGTAWKYLDEPHKRIRK